MGIRIFNHKGSIGMNFVGIKLKEDTPLEQGIEEGIILQLSNFALVNAREEAQVWVESEGDSYILVSLNSHHPQHAADVIFTDQEIKLFVKGKGEVHVTGTFAIDDSGAGQEAKGLPAAPAAAAAAEEAEAASAAAAAAAAAAEAGQQQQQEEEPQEQEQGRQTVNLLF